MASGQPVPYSWLSLPVTWAFSLRASPAAPVSAVEWTDENSNTAFNCYGWGTARAFEGGIFAIMFGDNLMFFAEFDWDCALTGCTDAIHDAARNAQDELISGELPEGMENPEVH